MDIDIGGGNSSTGAAPSGYSTLATATIDAEDDIPSRHAGEDTNAEKPAMNMPAARAPITRA
ncbi:MAG: hypothetical protein GYA46_11215 [candidate division Zixibacteria bacterium]|nr:hypothetical protein [candidate division Zixibacteria bacterium]